MNSNDEKLNKHVEKVLEIKRNSSSEQQLTLEELKEIDLSMGISEQEWNSMMKKAEDDVLIAQSHYTHGNYIDALQTAEAATSINPYHTKAYLIIAEAAFKLYQSKGDSTYWDTSEKAAKEALKQNPQEGTAIKVIAALRESKSNQKDKKKQSLMIVLIVVGVLSLLAAYLLWPQGAPTIDKDLRLELIEEEENLNAAWAQVENVIARRDQLIPQLLQLVNTDDKNIRQLSEDVKAIREKIVTADANTNIALQAQLQDKIKQLTAMISSKIKSKDNALVLAQIEGAGNRIAVEGRRYNEKVRLYNIKIKKLAIDFPEYQTKPYFKGK